jgi:hypothetical protein
MIDPGGAVRELQAAHAAPGLGATEEEIRRLEETLGVRLPPDHRQFLRWSNGWEGECGESWLVLDGIAEMLASNDPALTEGFEGYVFFGGDGGLESHAFEYLGSPLPRRVVAIDRNTNALDTFWPLGASLTEALRRLRLGRDDPRP